MQPAPDDEIPDALPLTDDSTLKSPEPPTDRDAQFLVVLKDCRRYLQSIGLLVGFWVAFFVTAKLIELSRDMRWYHFIPYTFITLVVVLVFTPDKRCTYDNDGEPFVSYHPLRVIGWILVILSGFVMVFSGLR